MSAATPGELERAEDRLQEAMLRGDVSALDSLLDENVVYVGPDGAEVGKQADLESHRTGFLHLTAVTELSRSSLQFDYTGTTRVRLHLTGTVGDSPLDADVVYTRTWRFTKVGWRVIQAQGAVAR